MASTLQTIDLLFAVGVMALAAEATILYAHMQRQAVRPEARDGVTAGMIPCPEALGVLLLAIGLQRVALGLMMIVAFSVGLPHTMRMPRRGSCFVGRMDQEKHVDELIRAVAALPAQRPARLELINDGPERDAWTALAARLGIADRVRFRGLVSEEALLEAYAGAAGFCMPGTAELQSLATLEAMASATPVVAADAMALPHLVRPVRSG
jgi:hypothetical protein